jgi:tripeptide aminopeptidase
MNLKERFLKYVSFDTQGDESSQSYPSTDKQLVLLEYLAEEMRQLGLTGVEMDKYGYVMGTLPATRGYEHRPVIGFIAHVDTSPDMSGANVKPQIIENYDGGNVKLNSKVTMTVKEFPELARYKDQTIITTDGTTLLGADDKAGIAEIMTAAEYLLAHPEIPHGKIRIGFTPDEELGRGVDHFDVERFGARFGYTVDGGIEGELEYENFNAAGARFAIHGQSIHPGNAKDKMVNALQVACEVNAMLPPCQRPEHTSGYEGFYHLVGMGGGLESAEISYIIRDHSRPKFDAKKQFARDVADFLNRKYGEGTVELILKDQYYNMKEMVEPHPEVIEKAVAAMEMAGVKPIIKPIRGGTDGSRLSYMGLPCPNLFTGGLNFHGKFECVSLNAMQKATDTIVNLARLWGE